jgi:DnaD/phage-associated family protein
MYADLGADISREEMARHLSMEDEDVLKAWTYWENLGAVRKIRKNPENKFDYDIEFISLKGQLYGEKPSKKSFAADHSLHSLMGDNEIREMFTEIERLMGRVISTTEMMEITSWIQDFDVTPELIIYGYKYSVKRKKKDIKYIARVIKSWAENNLRDVMAVEHHLNEYETRMSLHGRVFQALGFNRNATEEERRIMDRWFGEMGFTIDKVLEACKKTSGISNPNLNYVNKVLASWHEDIQNGRTPGSGNDNGSNAAKELTTGEIMKYYELLQRQNEAAAEKRRRQVYETVPRIKEIEDEMAAQNAEMSKIIISGRVDRETAMEQLRIKMEELNMEKAFLLTDNGFELDQMDIKYRCPECKDTGMLETGEKCLCFGEVTREKLNLITRQKTE